MGGGIGGRMGKGSRWTTGQRIIWRQDGGGGESWELMGESRLEQGRQQVTFE